MMSDIHSVLMAKKDQGRWAEEKNLMDYIYPIKKESSFQGVHFCDRGQLSFVTGAQSILELLFLEIFKAWRGTDLT